MKRYAIVKNARDREQLEAYLPNNYKVVYEYLGSSYFEDDERRVERGREGGTALSFIIKGEDDHGWTLDGYVIPRLGSGLIWAREIDLSHPIFKEIPADA